MRRWLIVVGLAAALACPSAARAVNNGYTNTWVDFEHNECEIVKEREEHNSKCFGEKGERIATNGWRPDLEKAWTISEASSYEQLKPFHDWLEKHVQLAMGDTEFHLARKWFFDIPDSPALRHTDEFCTLAPLTSTNRGAILKATEEANSKIEAETPKKYEEETGGKKFKLKGVWLDDANYGQGEKHTCGENHEQKPNAEATEWTAVIGELRSKFGSGFTIDMNDEYEHYKEYLSEKEGKVEIKAGPFKSALERANLINQEFGTGNIDKSLNEYERYIGWAHFLNGKGVHVVLSGHGEPIERAIIKEEAAAQNEIQEYELATYYAFNDGADYVGAYYAAADTPKKFWHGWCERGEYNAGSECPTSATNLEMGIKTPGAEKGGWLKPCGWPIYERDPINGCEGWGMAQTFTKTGKPEASANLSVAIPPKGRTEKFGPLQGKKSVEWPESGSREVTLTEEHGLVAHP